MTTPEPRKPVVPLSMRPTAVPRNLKTLGAAMAFAAAAYFLMKFASSRHSALGPMGVYTVLPFAAAAGLAFWARFTLLQCLAAGALVYVFILSSIWSSGWRSVGVFPVIAMPFSLFLGHLTGERLHARRIKRG